MLIWVEFSKTFSDIFSEIGGRRIVGYCSKGSTRDDDDDVMIVEVRYQSPEENLAEIPRSRNTKRTQCAPWTRILQKTSIRISQNFRNSPDTLALARFSPLSASCFRFSFAPLPAPSSSLSCCFRSAVSYPVRSHVPRLRSEWTKWTRVTESLPIVLWYCSLSTFVYGVYAYSNLAPVFLGTLDPPPCKTSLCIQLASV